MAEIDVIARHRKRGDTTDLHRWHWSAVDGRSL